MAGLAVAVLMAIVAIGIVLLSRGRRTLGAALVILVVLFITAGVTIERYGVSVGGSAHIVRHS